MRAWAGAGEWRKLAVAIKTVVFQNGEDDSYTKHVASEAAIASNLMHKNVVNTYSHDIRNITTGPAVSERSLNECSTTPVSVAAAMYSWPWVSLCCVSMSGLQGCGVDRNEHAAPCTRFGFLHASLECAGVCLGVCCAVRV
jgi:hypothetical protein